MRILFDQGTPIPIRRFLSAHVVRTAAEEGWSTLRNSELLDAAESAGFEVFVTTDKNLRYQQNLTHRSIAIVVLGKQQWPDVRSHIDVVVEALNRASPATYTEVDIP
jgi:hypothetical protein